MLVVHVEQGDVLDAEVELLVSTGNVHLNLSGGVNGGILERGGASVQAELRSYLSEAGLTFVEPGTVVETGPGPLSVRVILHAVAINGFYESSRELVATTIRRALERAEELEVQTVALPALATGYGPLSVETFALALGDALERPLTRLEVLRIVLRTSKQVAEVREVLAGRVEGFRLAERTD